jgi:glycosyltransferase involved in cell wall biosynthesis
MTLTVAHLISQPIPPKLNSGGSSRSVTWLAQAQAEAGNNVIVCSPEGHSTDFFTHLELPPLASPETLNRILPGSVDIIHLHEGFHAIEKQSRELNRPFIQTIRNNAALETPGQLAYNAVYLSAAHMKLHNGRKFVYNGIPINQYKYSQKKQNFLLFLAKVKRSKKGVQTAIQVASALGEKLVIAGGYRMGSPATWVPFWPGVDSVGPVGGEKKLDLLALTKALLVPIRWDEPFGLTVAEAFASGTPVIAMRRGAMPELIIDGKTGFICDTAEDMMSAVTRLNEISPETCRREAEARFSIEREALAYSGLYKEIMEGATW